MTSGLWQARVKEEVKAGISKEIKRMKAIWDGKELKFAVKSPPTTTRIAARRIESVIKSA